MNKISLRVHLIFSIVLVLVVSIVFGGMIDYWHAIHKVDEEMHAALDFGSRTVQNATDDIEEAADPLRQLQLLVEDFDGSRHLRASFLNINDVVIVSSQPRKPDSPAPAWFNHFIARSPQTSVILLPPAFSRYGKILLETDSHNEIDEVWSDIFVTLSILAVFGILVSILIYWILGRAIYFLSDMSRAFSRVGSGDYQQRCQEKGPHELADLAHHFNEMVERLALMEDRNRRLEIQLRTMQEEERADLARDLHDEIGPLLFALSMDISTIQQESLTSANSRTAAHLDAMLSTISKMQQHVRSMLGKLRPAILLDLGLSPAIENLVAFWRLRNPDVLIDVMISEDTFGEELDSTIYRIFQEGLNNAFRHGHPSRILLRASGNATEADVEVSDNGKGLTHGNQRFGFGLTGMQERIVAAGGTFEIKNRTEINGVTLAARIPFKTRQDYTGKKDLDMERVR